MPILQKIGGFQDDLVSIRRDIHRHPEIGFEEVPTAAIVAGKLESWGIEGCRPLSGIDTGFRRNSHFHFSAG